MLNVREDIARYKMKTRDLIVKIPKPNKDGTCPYRCPFWDRCSFELRGQIPGKGCPWYNGNIKKVK